MQPCSNKDLSTDPYSFIVKVPGWNQNCASWSEGGLLLSSNWCPETIFTFNNWRLLVSEVTVWGLRLKPSAKVQNNPKPSQNLDKVFRISFLCKTLVMILKKKLFRTFPRKGSSLLCSDQESILWTVYELVNTVICSH